MNKSYKIRYRKRVQASRAPGLRAAWDEWQVIDGRKIVARFDMEQQAKAWIETASAKHGELC